MKWRENFFEERKQKKYADTKAQEEFKSVQETNRKAAEEKRTTDYRTQHCKECGQSIELAAK